MQYTKLGNTGLDVSRITLGCMSFGDGKDRWPWALNEEESIKIIRHAYDIGINFFDTANIYSYGTSEEFLGKALNGYADREQLVIATKVYNATGIGPNKKGLSRKHIFHEVDQSLSRLNMDYIDLLIIHRFDEHTPVEETMKALHDLVEMGKVRYLGASAMNAWQFAKMQQVAKENHWTSFVSMQNKYNLLYREEEREMIPLLMDQKIAMTPYQPLQGGRLARNENDVTERSKTQSKHATALPMYTDASEDEITKRVGILAEKYGVSRANIALSWHLSKPYITSLIVGCTSIEKLNDTVKCLEVSLSDEDIHYLEEAYIPHPLRF